MKNRAGFFPFILLLALLPVAAGYTRTYKAESLSEEPIPDCGECHQEVYASWELSKHHNGLGCINCHEGITGGDGDDEIEGHQSEGEPQSCIACHTTGFEPALGQWENNTIHCTACHSPFPSNHPEDLPPTNRSEELCGRCHTHDREEWDSSRHSQVGVVCIDCHSQHQTSLRQGGVSAQCANCHGVDSAGFAHSEHAASGLTCANCHMAPTAEAGIGGNAEPDHAFTVEVSTCASCHQFLMHTATEIPDNPFFPYGGAPNNSANTKDPNDPYLNSLALIALAGAVGLGIGLIAYPSLARRYQRYRDKDK